MSDRHLHPATGDASHDEIRLRHAKRELVAGQDGITIGGHEFPLHLVDRVVYRAATRINQASYVIGLAQGARTHTFAFTAYRKGTELEDAAVTWRRLVDLLESTVCPRIAESAVRTVSAGTTVTFGGPRSSRVDVSPEGVRPRRPFARTIPWARVTTADLAGGLARVWAAGADGTPARKPALCIDMTGWNAVVLPRVVRHFAA
ncbi:hypothetical protein [Actinacidiphila bryophytorum]|uniref:Uncharacterized protein n=1 Tax=Actinacidiphila bryophytorum TaxID=1436133 RepID=A0A9W4ECQ3_9ACTN|nr:hypothetical protein [Actinacidiphila bryophytorum]MBM9438455.1 hypothetical protein [Actinacidiphila bryophytorum]MBN6542552.1 hypothetical protein [Actinacidiphila bryophytorum]CAG7613408.1 conserved hypothetical protein [Actinacidiphila bryophytorum]